MEKYLIFLICDIDICVFGRFIYVILIVRRLKEFVGIRFLKRGVNDEVCIVRL